MGDSEFLNQYLTVWLYSFISISLLYFIGTFLKRKFFDNKYGTGNLNKKDMIIEESSNDPFYYYEKSCSYNYMDDYEQVEKYFKKALELDPNNAYYNYNLGLLHLRCWEEIEKSEEYYNRAIELDPNNACFYYERAHLYNAMGKREEAIEDMRKAIELS